MLMRGGCHCGNIGFSLIWDPDPDEIPARACTCSFCVRHGNVWTSSPTAALRVEVRDPALVSRYAFGTGTAEFHVCARCGVVPVVTSRVDGRLYAVVNVNTIEGLEPHRLRRTTVDLDDEEAAARLARRKRNWIADVELVPVSSPGKSPVR